MLIQVVTDNHIHGTEGLRQRVEDQVSAALGRFADQITRVEVHLSDENAQKAGIDKKCRIEARVAGRPVLSVSHSSDDLMEAVSGAADRLERALDHQDDRLHHHKGHTSMGGDQTI